MQVFSWNQKRKRLLRQLAGLDSAVARRVVQVETAWDEASQEMAQSSVPDATIQEFVTADDFLFQPKPPEEVTQVKQEEDADMPLPDGVATATAIVATNSKTLASYLD